MQRVVKGIGGHFEKVADAIKNDFLLFDDTFEENDQHVSLANLPVKHAGLALPNPINSADANYDASSRCNVRELAVIQTLFSCTHIWNLGFLIVAGRLMNLDGLESCMPVTLSFATLDVSAFCCGLVCWSNVLFLMAMMPHYPDHATCHIPQIA